MGGDAHADVIAVRRDIRRDDIPRLELEDERVRAGQLLEPLLALRGHHAVLADPVLARCDDRERPVRAALELPDALHSIGVGRIASDAVERIRRVDEHGAVEQFLDDTLLLQGVLILVDDAHSIIHAKAL